MNTKKINSHSEEETREFAFNLAKSLPLGSVILLRGDLGAGKTVFSGGFAKGLGITSPLSSPTYTIVQEYDLDNSKRLYHLDLYRIDNSTSALAFGVDEFLNDPNAYALVEWAERIESLIPENAIEVKISHISENERLIEIV